MIAVPADMCGSPPSEPRPASDAAPATILLGAVMVLAVAVRVVGLQAQSLSMDEFAELSIARQSLHYVIFINDGFPPLFNLLLHGWLNLLPGDEAARWLAAVFGVLAVFCIGKLAQEVCGTRAGLATALLLALSPIHIWHSQEGRAYILYFLVAVLALWMFFRAMNRDRLSDWILYALASIVGVYTHYYFAILLLIDGLLILRERRTVRQLRHPAWAHVILTLGILPLVWIGRPDFAAESTAPFAAPFQLGAVGYTYFSFIAGYSIGPSVRELHVIPTRQLLAQILPWLAIVGGVVVVLGYDGAQALRSRTWVVRLATLATLPVLVGTGMAALTGVTFQVRHVLWAAIPVLVWLGAGLSRGARRWPARTAAIGLLLVSVTSIYNRNRVDRYKNEDVRGVAAFLKAQPGPNSTVLVSPGYMARPVRRYLGPTWRTDSLPDVDRWNSNLADAIRVIDTTVAPGHTFWLVYSRPFHGDPNGQLRQSLVRQRDLRHRTDFAGVVLYEGREP